jgi:hypothetical protein
MAAVEAFDVNRKTTLNRTHSGNSRFADACIVARTEAF